jgi:catechol 2,3-dioxygenase-like lactoylglutathione lyase family enzyme
VNRSFLLAAMAAAIAWPAAAQTLPPIGDAERPTRASGVGLNVADLERSMRFYTEVLGFKVAARVPAQGPAQEYLLGLTGNLRADTLIVLRKGAIQPGATSFGRIILVAPDGAALAQRVVAAGYAPPRVLHGTNFVADPDGYVIELYQRPAPKGP